MMKQTIGAIVLAAGKGSRMKSKNVNKVVLPVADKPMILHVVHRLEELSVYPIVIVVGFAKESVMNILGEKVYFAEQTKRLGTGHAALCGLRKMPRDVDHILVMYGDDFSYPKEKMQALITKHISSGAALTFLTVDVANPFALGRIVRNDKGQVMKIVEEKDATEEERDIHEVNPGCYVFSRKFLETYLPRLKKSPVTGEYYLTSLVDMAIVVGEPVETTQAGRILWRGVNTPEELQEATRMYLGEALEK